MRMRLATLVLLAALIPAALPLPVAHAGQVRISLTAQFQFVPNTVTINQGDRVVWVWLASGHDCVSGNGDTGTPDGVFSSGTLQTVSPTLGTAFTFKFASPGTQGFFCEAHWPDMQGTVTIVPSGAAVSDFRITEVQYTAAGGLDRIEITNLGTAAGDLGRYRISVGTNTQQVVPLNSVPVPVGGRVTIRTHESGSSTATTLFMPGLGDLPAPNGSVSLFAPQAQNNALGALSSALIVDFVQYGAPTQPNSATATAGGVWPAGTFVAGLNDPSFDIAFCGNSTDRGTGFWAVGHANFGSQPPCATPAATTTWGRVKILYR